MNPTCLRPQFGRFISLLVRTALLVSIFVATPRSSARSPRKTKPPAQVTNPQGNSQRQRPPASLLSFLNPKLALGHHAGLSFLRNPILTGEGNPGLISALRHIDDSIQSERSTGNDDHRFDLLLPPVPQLGTSKIVFASNRDGSMQIYVMNADGSGVARITDSGANDDFPRWSPDGARILFQSDRENSFSGKYDIYVMNADGSGVVRLTSDANDDSLPAWSPDGTRIIFQTLRNGSKYQVYVMNADGSNQANLSNSVSNDGEASWSPDAGRIAFTSDRDREGFKSIYVMNSNGTGQQRITFSSGDVQDSQPAWSPDGSRLAFVSTRDSTTETWQETADYERPEDDGQVTARSRVTINKEVYVMNADGSGQTRLTNDLGNDDLPAWSPDGTKIIFRSDRERDSSDPIAQLLTMNADGTGQIDLSSTNDGDYSVSWVLGWSVGDGGNASSPAPDSMSAPVTINFDSQPQGAIIFDQYQSAIFSATGFSSPPGGCGSFVMATTGERYSSYPNGIRTGVRCYYNSAYAGLYVSFPIPVNNLSFNILNMPQSFFAVGGIDVYQNGSYYGSFGLGGGNPNSAFPVTFLRTIPHITGVYIYQTASVPQLGGFIFDDFAFTPELTANITNPRVSGGLDGTNQSSLVGADISLHATSNRTGGTYSWSFTPSSIPVTYVSGSATSQDITIRPTATGVLTAKLTYKLNGVSVTPTVNINVIIPTLQGFVATETSDHLTRDEGCNNLSNGVFYTLGCYHQPVPGGPFTGTIGIDWAAIAQIPSATYLSNPAQSGIKFVQVVSTYSERRFRGNTDCFTGRTSEFNVDSGWQLDDSDPYNHDAKYFSEGSLLLFEGNDNPSEPIELLTTPQYGYYSPDALSRQDQFETYIYYFTTDPVNHNPTQPIFQKPLGFPNSNLNTPTARLSWSWGGLVVFDYYSVPNWLTHTLTSNTPIGAFDATPAAERPYSGFTRVQSNQWRPCGTAAVTSNQIDDSIFFIEQLYRDFLQRNADSDGENFWRSNITHCVFDEHCISDKRTDVARAFFYSTEFVGLHPELALQRGTHGYNSQFVFACYRGFLRREPDAYPDNNWNGFNFWVAKLDSSNPDAGDWKYNEMIKAFLDSTEYRDRFVALVP